MNHHAGILHGWPDWRDQRSMLILAHTPGVPLEWIYAALSLSELRRRRLRTMLSNSATGYWVEKGRENAASVVQGDGWKMLQAVCPRYAGPAPLWSQVELRNDTRSDAAIAAVLGVDRKKVWRWRNNTIFDPLTGKRVRPNRGTSII